ncbi:MAG: class I SAM-dependent methyltransferase [Pirellulaceae bacterium]
MVADEYELLDFGGSRKLERFGAVVLDRPSPAADSSRKQSPRWSQPDIVLDSKGRLVEGVVPESWRVRISGIEFGLRLTPFGHVGVFPEQQRNWEKLRAWCEGFNQRNSRSPKVLNLFAYTGGSTLSCALGGAEVVHVDASQPAVTWARQNAILNGLGDFPIRWITEDAAKFVQRERKRGNHYDVVILDPPGFGHGPSGKRWELRRDLPDLLDGCAGLLQLDSVKQLDGAESELGRLLLLTSHSSDPSESEIKHWLSDATGCSAKANRNLLKCKSNAGKPRALDAGFGIWLDC